MFVRSPSEFYLKYLITHPDGWNNRSIIEHTAEHRLVCGPFDYLDRLRERLHPPDPFFPRRRRHEPSKQFLLEEQIYGLWHRNEHTVMAVKLLDNPSAQEAAHAMLTVGADTTSVALLLDKRFELPFSVQAVERYKKYFWNTDIVNTAELRELCRDAAGGPAKTNPLVLASELPATPMSAVLVQMRMGFVPSTLNQYEGLKKAAETCTMRMYEALMLGGKGAAEEFRNWAWGMKFIVEMTESMTAPEEDLRKMLGKVELVTKPVKTPTIAKLSKGNFSDGTFVQDPNKKKKDEE